MINNFEDLKTTLENYAGARVNACGSRVTCSKVNENSDWDYLVELPQNKLSEVVALLDQEGWKWEGDSKHYQVVADSSFMSWRKGEINLIVTTSAEFARKHRVATFICTKLDIESKENRIFVFQAILYGKI